MIFTIVQLMLCRLFLSTLEFETSKTGQKQAERTYARDIDRAYSGRQRSPKSGPLYKDTESLVSVNQDLKEEVRKEAESEEKAMTLREEENTLEMRQQAKR